MNLDGQPKRLCRLIVDSLWFKFRHELNRPIYQVMLANLTEKRFRVHFKSINFFYNSKAAAILKFSQLDTWANEKWAGGYLIKGKKYKPVNTI